MNTTFSLRQKLRYCIILLGCALSAAQCGKKDAAGTDTEKLPGYFSIRQFAVDQFDIYHHQPFTLTKYTVVDGKLDSTYTNFATMDWAAIYKTFFATDIGDQKFIGQYQYSEFTENLTGTLNLVYEAKDPKLFTQKLMIMADQEHGKVKSIYIEAGRSGTTEHLAQRLYYAPLDIIQIQEQEQTATGKERSTRVEYVFMR